MSQRPSRFVFTDRSYDPKSGEIRLGYALDDQPLTERFFLPPNLAPRPEAQEAIDASLSLLHWIAGVSYWKTHCPSQWVFQDQAPNRDQASALTTIYKKGLAEFAWHNRIELEIDLGSMIHDLTDSSLGSSPSPERAQAVGLGEGVLLPLGGGKDSLVAWHRLHNVVPPQHLMSVQVGPSPLIQSLGEWMVSEGMVSKHWVIRRMLDPELARMNAEGAMNGHVPITAINSAILAVFALAIDAHWVAFANERSADEATLIDDTGQPVTHQFSKSFEFEVLFDDWIKRYVAADLSVFSALRTQRELAIVGEFAKLTEFHRHFTSCNRNFHIDPSMRGPTPWCGRCPKCHFVFLAMAVFLDPQELVAIFGADLLNLSECIDGFQALLALDGAKPFECVGEASEARAAMLTLAQSTEWKDHLVVKHLAPLLSNFAVPSLEEMLKPTGPHLLPEDLQP